MKYSLYTTLIALAALNVKADERYCDGAMQDPEANGGTMSWAGFKSARLIFGNYVSLRFLLISSLSPRSSSKALERDVQTEAEPAISTLAVHFVFFVRHSTDNPRPRS
jgi:hypothetical protein